MKNVIIKAKKLMALLFAVTVTMASCQYEEVAPANYPEQKIYMPAAYGGIFHINEIPKRIGDVPTPGSTYRFEVDLTNGRFIIPLGVYRAGVNNNGTFKIDIAVKADTIAQLISAGTLTSTEILPADAFTVPTSVDMNDGDELAIFNLSVNLNLLLNNYPDKKYALAINVSSAQRQSNPKLSTTIVLIDTKIMKPTANYNSIFDTTNPKRIVFQNTSLFSNGYSWDFGDGSGSTETSPSHIYAASGTYTVRLTALGITGEADKSIKTVDIVVP
jgi:hypothetical protein